MKSPELVAEAQRLRGEGLTYREIGERFGVSNDAAHAWVNDPLGAIRKARTESLRTTCKECGGTCSGTGRTGICQHCNIRRIGRLGPPEAGRVTHARRMWTQEAVRLAIAARAEELGATPAANDVRPSLVKSAQREYGSWSSAVRAAGLEPYPPGGSSRTATAAVKRGRSRQMVTGGRMGATQRTNRLSGKPTW